MAHSSMSANDPKRTSVALTKTFNRRRLPLVAANAADRLAGIPNALSRTYRLSGCTSHFVSDVAMQASFGAFD